jgi:hypothetical protein
MNHIFNCFMFVNPGNGSFLKYIFVYILYITKKIIVSKQLKNSYYTHARFLRFDLKHFILKLCVNGGGQLSDCLKKER